MGEQQQLKPCTNGGSHDLVATPHRGVFVCAKCVDTTPPCRHQGEGECIRGTVGCDACRTRWAREHGLCACEPSMSGASYSATCPVHGRHTGAKHGWIPEGRLPTSDTETCGGCGKRLGTNPECAACRRKGLRPEDGLSGCGACAFSGKTEAERDALLREWGLAYATATTEALELAVNQPGGVIDVMRDHATHEAFHQFIDAWEARNKP